MSNPFLLEPPHKPNPCPNIPSSEDTNMSSSSDHTHPKPSNPLISKATLNDYHQYKETKLLINKYGNDFFLYSKEKTFLSCGNLLLSIPSAQRPDAKWLTGCMKFSHPTILNLEHFFLLFI